MICDGAFHTSPTTSSAVVSPLTPVGLTALDEVVRDYLAKAVWGTAAERMIPVRQLPTNDRHTAWFEAPATIH